MRAKPAESRRNKGSRLSSASGPEGLAGAGLGLGGAGRGLKECLINGSASPDPPDHGHPAPSSRPSSASGCPTSPARPTRPTFAHQYDKWGDFRGRFGFSGKKGTSQGTRSSVEARYSTIFADAGAPRHTCAPRHTLASPQGPEHHAGAGEERDTRPPVPGAFIRRPVRLSFNLNSGYISA